MPLAVPKLLSRLWAYLFLQWLVLEMPGGYLKVLLCQYFNSNHLIAHFKRTLFGIVKTWPWFGVPS